MVENLEKNITNEVVIVTGGSRGIGASIVKYLARKGFTVILDYNKSETCAKNVENELKKEGFTISLDVCNLSNNDGKDVVQVYLKHLNASIVVRVLELKGFKKVFVPKSSKTNVEITLTYEDFALWDEFMNFTVEPGEVLVCVGQDSQNYQEFKVVVSKEL